MNCLETHDLHYRFGRQSVLSGIDLQVPSGSIYGFLGPNGAGKTTTLRLLLGLLSTQHGDISIFGSLLTHNRIAILSRIGSVIEMPSIYGHLTAVENLRLLQIVRHCPQRRIGEVLELVHLAHTGRKRARHFSLGMRQRLGLAAALLHEPDLLILDEPTNGLDPNGIIEIRNLLVELNRSRGITILVSSHLLAEVERLATHVGVLSGGRLRFQGTMTDLRRLRQQVVSVRLSTSDNNAALAILQDRGIDAQHRESELELHPLPPASLAQLIRTLVERSVDVYEMRNVRNDLESIFLNLIQENA